jgi:hypothetical protein
MYAESDLNITQLIASQNDSHNEFININLSTVKMAKSPITINFNLLQTDIWYTSFGMSVKDMCNPYDKILLEGELYKYKPGIDTMYITRW